MARGRDLSAAEFIEPTAASRRKFGVLFVIALVAGVTAIKLLEAYLDEMRSRPVCDLIVTMRWLWLLANGALFVLGVWVARLAYKALELKQWPLPDTWVIVRTPIHRGKSARWRACALVALSLLLTAGSAVEAYAVEDYLQRVDAEKCAR